MTPAAQKNDANAKLYYRAIGEKELTTVARLVDANVRLISPMSNLEGKEASLQAARGYSGMVSSIKVRSTFATDSEAMLAYDGDFGAPIGICRTAALLSFRDNLITRIELFFDARPFGNLQNPASSPSR
jgi:hypothetical protein